MGRGWLIVGVVLLVGCRSSPPESNRLAPGANAEIVAVIDGDTVVASFAGQEEKVRLIGIDTPETVKPESPVECYGPEASQFTKSLLPEGTAVRIERDVEPRDAYDRLLGYVYRAADGLFVNETIIANGYATVLNIEPNTAYHDRFVAAATAAERADVGLWSACADQPG